MARGRKLNSETINQIHELLRQKVPYSQIHERLGVSKGIISKIANTETDSPAQRINNERKMNDDQTLNNEHSNPALSKPSRVVPRISSVQSRKVNDERDERSSNASIQKVPIITRQTVDGWIDNITDVIWNRGGKKAKLKELQQGFIDLREQFTE